MAISTAIQKGSTVYVYDEKDHQIWSKSGDLHGFTGSTVSIKKGSTIYVYNEKGNQVSSHSC